MRAGWRTRRAWAAGGAVLLVASVAACGRRQASLEPPQRLAVSVFADTGRGERLHIVPPPLGGRRERARVWLTQVTPSRPAPINAPLPDAAPAPVEDPGPAPPPFPVDPDLKPPILKTPGSLHVPPHARRGFVELDVRIGEDGTVTDAIWAGGSPDSALTDAATTCALAMRFYPALRAGKPTAVWCRQRFDFTGRRD